MFAICSPLYWSLLRFPQLTLLTQFPLFHRSHNTFLSHSPASLSFPACVYVCMYVCLCVHSLLVFVSQCQWFPTSAFVLLAWCHVSLGQNRLYCCFVVGDDKWVKVVWRSLETALGVDSFCSTCHHMCLLAASSMITCGILPAVYVLPLNFQNCTKTQKYI